MAKFDVVKITRLILAVFASVMVLGTQAIATPIFIVSTSGGILIGTNELDTGGIDVCKIHYAGSTAVLRATTIARVPKFMGSKSIIYDSTQEEWKVLDPKKNMAEIS